MSSPDLSLEIISGINQYADDCERGIQLLRSHYASAKAALETKHVEGMRSLKQNEQNAVSRLTSKCADLEKGAKALLKEIDKLDAATSYTDKYYSRSKQRHAGDGHRCSELESSDDYIESLKIIRGRFQCVSSKYTQRILPFLINDINYLLSKSRKDDYRELHALRKAAVELIDEISQSLPSIISEETDQIKKDYSALNAQEEQVFGKNKEALECEYNANVDHAADVMCTQLERILPDAVLEEARLKMLTGINRMANINSDRSVYPKEIMLGRYVYPLQEYIGSPIVSSLISSKCAGLIKPKEMLVLPAMFSMTKPINVLFREERHSDAALMAMHSIMLSFICGMPASRLKIAVVDPEQHGSSISPFFELKRLEPEMFVGDIAISPEDIAMRINEISTLTDDILQYKLGSGKETVYDLDAEDISSMLLAIFDFPNGFNDNAQSLLRNVLLNGYRCGIHVAIMHNTQGMETLSADQCKRIGEIDKLCTIVTCQNDGLKMNGLECMFLPLPDGKNLNIYLNRYLLTCAGIRNKGYVFHKFVKELIASRDADAAQACIDKLRSINEQNDATWCLAGKTAAFPEQIVLGGAMYPFSIFDGSPVAEKVRKHFRVSQSKGAGNGINQDVVCMPLCFDTRDGLSLYMEYAEQDSASALGCAHHVMWRLLSSIPVSKVRFSVMSCERSANSIVPFLELMKAIPALFDDSIYVTQEAVYERLQRLSQYVDETLQSKLGHRFDNIIEYNFQTPNRAEAIIILTIFDYPKGFDTRCNDLLNNIIKNGRRCGVYTILCHNRDIQYSRYDTLDDYLAAITKNCITTECKANTYCMQPFGIALDFSENPDRATINAFIDSYKTEYERIQRKGISFLDILDNALFERSSSKCVEIPIGLGDGDAVVNVTLGTGSSHHALIAGATGSGKSTLLHTLIMSSLVHYTPDQLHLYLLDFKSGTEFKVYEANRLPHMRLLALDAVQEFGESILEDLVGEMSVRSERFKAAGCSKVEEFIKVTGNKMPRILVIMDEFQILYNDTTNRRVANNCAELTKRIVTEGRAFGIHLLMATQSTKVIGDLTLSYGTVEQMRIRIGMKCGEDDARYLFSDRNDMKALEMMKGPIGTAVMNPEYMEEDNISLRVAYCDHQSMMRYQEEIARKFANYPCTLQIFEGNRTVNFLDYTTRERLLPYSDSVTRLHFGERIKVAPPFILDVDKRRRHNMLICGANEYMMENLNMLYKLSILLNEVPEIYEIDGEWLVSENYADSASSTIASMTERYHCAATRKEIVLMIRSLYDQYKARKQEGCGSQVFIFIRNLQYLDIVQQMFRGDRVLESSYLSSPQGGRPGDFDFGQDMDTCDTDSSTEKILKMIGDGSNYGFFFIVSSCEYQIVKESMHYGENVLAKFPERVLFALSDSDAESLVENVSVERLKENTVCFSDGVKKNFQFKPYIAPAGGELLEYISLLVGRKE